MRAMSRRPPRPWLNWTLAVTGSLVLHAAVYLVFRLSGVALLDVNLELETDLEFGAMNEVVAVTLDQVSAPPSTPEEMQNDPLEPIAVMPATSGDAGVWISGPPDAVPPPPPDAGVPDAAPKPEPDAAPKPEKPEENREDVPPDAGPPPPRKKDANPEDAPPADAAPPSTVASTAPSGPADAGAAPPSAASSAATSAPPAPTGLAAAPPSGAIALPAGAQIALRLDLAAIRASPLASDVRSLLSSIWDWKQLLDGSGVDPIGALDRVLIASPGLRRDRMVLAGALAGTGTGIVQQAVQNLARARGVRAEWTMVEGRLVAPWANQDATPRHVAVLDTQHFAIARLEDLPAVLALAEARAIAELPPPTTAPGAPDAGPPAPPPLTGPAALLWLPAGTVVSGEVDGARRLVRGNSALVPERLRIALVSLPDDRVKLEAEGSYASPDEAKAAQKVVDAERRRLSTDALVGLTLRMLGLATTLDRMVVEIREERRLYSEVELTHAQVRAILAYLRSSLEARARRATPGPASMMSSPPGDPLEPKGTPLEPKGTPLADP